ncbi:MAG: hypothetical protein LBL84_02565 [Candidatus Nomurabacteria bacterium]|jgi:hypothetical protein|nr:hypothetical protein [Candidatus Nomurabacteria bacterium]
MATVEQLLALQRRMNEIWRRIEAGSLSTESALEQIQAILNGERRTHGPSWAIYYKYQIEIMHKFFRNVDIPMPPDDYTPRIGGALLLVCNLDSLEKTVETAWDLIGPRAGVRLERLSLAPKSLRLLSGRKRVPEFRWVEFCPNIYRGKTPREARKLSKLDELQLAGTEVLWAAVMFPDWVREWDSCSRLHMPAPNLSVLRYQNDGKYVLGVRPLGRRGAYKLCPILEDSDCKDYASPVIRELS